MLTKRANILFEETDWQMLTTLASQQKTSVGHLVRRAVKTAYRDTPLARTHALIRAERLTIKHRIKSLSPAEIKEYINYGRKY